MAGFQLNLFTKTGREPDSALGSQFVDPIALDFPLELTVSAKQRLRRGA